MDFRTLIEITLIINVMDLVFVQKNSQIIWIKQYLDFE